MAHSTSTWRVTKYGLVIICHMHIYCIYVLRHYKLPFLMIYGPFLRYINGSMSLFIFWAFTENAMYKHINLRTLLKVRLAATLSTGKAGLYWVWQDGPDIGSDRMGHDIGFQWHQLSALLQNRPVFFLVTLRVDRNMNMSLSWEVWIGLAAQFLDLENKK
jgi:hypothetical protein